MSKEEINKEVDDIIKSKLDSFKTLDEKDEYLIQIATSAFFDEDKYYVLVLHTKELYLCRISNQSKTNHQRFFTYGKS